MEPKDLKNRIIERMKKGPIFFYDILNEFKEEDYRKILQAWGLIREEHKLSRDEQGRYLFKAAEAP